MINLNNIVGRGKFLLLSLLTGLVLFAGSQTEIAAADAASIKAFQKIMDDPKVTTKINMTNTKGTKYYVAFATYPLGTKLADGSTSYSGHAFVCFAKTDENGKITDFENKGLEVDPDNAVWKQACIQDENLPEPELPMYKFVCMVAGIPGKLLSVPAPTIEKVENMLITEVNKSQYEEAKKVCEKWDNGKKQYKLNVTDCQEFAMDVAKKLEKNKVKIKVPVRTGEAVFLDEILVNKGFKAELKKIPVQVGNVEVYEERIPEIPITFWPQVYENMLKLSVNTVDPKKSITVGDIVCVANAAGVRPFSWEAFKLFIKRAKTKLNYENLADSEKQAFIESILTFPNTYMKYFREVNAK